MLTPSCIAKHCNVTYDAIRRWKHGIIVGPYQRPVRLAERPTVHDLLDFLHAADGHPSLDPVPYHLLRSAHVRAAKAIAAKQERVPPGLRMRAASHV